MENIKKIINKPSIVKMIFIILCIIFAIPSFIYMLENKTILNFQQYFKFFLNDAASRTTQAIIYIVLLGIITIIYGVILKKREKLFKNTKKMFLFIVIIALIFTIVIPFMCSDVFYYLGIGRIGGTYGQNPYYVTIKDFVEQEENLKLLEQDTVLKQGYNNDWADSTVVYGPIWTLICQVIAGVTGGSIDIALYVFKLVNVLVHLANCYLIYKLSNKKLFVLLYGLNPFVLIEGMSSVHNDMFVVLFVLLAIYFLLKKKKILISMVFLALATGIKYFTILLVPFILIYYFRKEKPIKRFMKCIQYGIIFLVIFLIPYLIFIKDWNVFEGLFIQQEKLAKNFYIIILEHFTYPENLVTTINHVLLGSFAIIYIFNCLILLYKKEIIFRKEIQKYQYFLMAFLFLLITNFQPWYILWLFPCIMWQKAKVIKLIIGISILSEFANSIFLAYTEAWTNGIPFTFVMIVGSLLIIIYEQKKELQRKTRILLKK